MSIWNQFSADRPVILHQGVYKKSPSTAEAVFIITGMTIGAGVLGLPYVVAQVGLKIGLVFIIVLGVVMMFLNLMIGEIAARTRANLQIPGFAGKYLGRWAKELMTVIIVASSLGALLAYIVGEGRSLAALFGGESAVWSVVFWTIGSFIIWRGLQTAKGVEKVVSFTVIVLITGLSLFLINFFHAANWTYLNWGQVFLPYGVILFALHASPSIAESHALMPSDPKKFKRAVIIGSLIPIIVYVLFALAVVGATGLNTTEVATVGLGNIFGGPVLIIGNLFAVLAMFTGFIGLGVALKQSLVWDHKVKPFIAGTAVIAVPLALFLLGFHSFVGILDLVGGLFIGIEAAVIVLIYYQAKRRGDLSPGAFNLHYGWLLAVPVLLIFTLATLISFVKLFI